MVDVSENAIKNVFDRILSVSRERTEQEPIYKWMASKSEWFDTPEHISVMVRHPLTTAIELVVTNLIPGADWLVRSIYSDYSYYERLIAGHCREFFGSCCSVDKAHYILKCAIKKALKEEVPEFDPKPENFHHPESGTVKEWFDLVDGACRLRNGQPANYLRAYATLLCRAAAAAHNITRVCEEVSR